VRSSPSLCVRKLRLLIRFSVLLASLFVHCVLACSSPVAVHSQSSLSAGYEPAAIAEVVRHQARIGGVPRRATERKRIGWSVGNSFDAEILMEETPLVHVADAITPIITKSPPLPSADGRPVIHLNASLYAASQDVVMTSMLLDLVRGLTPSIGEGLCRILDMDVPECIFFRTLVDKGKKKRKGRSEHAPTL
jgi:hypothetical protein